MEGLKDIPDDPFNFQYKKEGWSEKRIQAEIDELAKHPLFIKDVSKLKDNEMLQALQAIMYDDEEDNEEELANTFYKQGNEIFRDRLLPALKKLKDGNITDPNERISMKGTKILNISLIIGIRFSHSIYYYDYCFILEYATGGLL